MKSFLKKTLLYLFGLITVFSVVIYTSALPAFAATVTIDSTNHTLQTGATSTITSGNISPGNNTCLIAYVFIGGTTVGTVGSIKNSGTNNGWLKIRQTKVSTDADIELWASFNTSSQTNITVTATTSSASMDMGLDVFVFGSVDTTGTFCSGAIASSSIKVDLGGVNQPSIVQTSSARNGDYFTWATINETSNNALTAGSNQTIVGDGNDTVDGFRYVSVKQNAATATAGTSVTDNGTWATAWTWGMINLEMQPAVGGGGSTNQAETMYVGISTIYLRASTLYMK